VGPQHCTNYPCICVCHDTFICVAWLIHMCDLTYSYVRHDLFVCVIGPHSCTCVKWHIHMYDTTHSYVWHDSFICVTWRIHMCDMTHSYVWHDSFKCETRLIHMCDVTRSYMWPDFIAPTTLSPIQFVTWLIHISRCDMTFICVTWILWYTWHDSFLWSEGAVGRHTHTQKHTHTHTRTHTRAILQPPLHCGNPCHDDLCKVIAIEFKLSRQTHSYLWHDSLIFVKWCILIWTWCDMTLICVTWIVIWYVLHGSFLITQRDSWQS